VSLRKNEGYKGGGDRKRKEGQKGLRPNSKSEGGSRFGKEHWLGRGGKRRNEVAKRKEALISKWPEGSGEKSEKNISLRAVGDTRARGVAREKGGTERRGVGNKDTIMEGKNSKDPLVSKKCGPEGSGTRSIIKEF